MTFSIYEECAKTTEGECLCLGVQDENGRIFPCIPVERVQLEELVALLNRSDISGDQVEEVVQDFEGYWIYKQMGNW